MLNITVECSHGVLTVRCCGRLVFGRESILFCLAGPHHRRDVIVDLSGVTAIDAAGIGALLSLQTTRTYLRLINPAKAVHEVLRLANLHFVFDITESECRMTTVVPTHGDKREFILQAESA